MNGPNAYVEVLADGTVPLKVRVGRALPFVLRQDDNDGADDRYERADTAAGYVYYVIEARLPLDEDGNVVRSAWLLLVWADDDGFSAYLYNDPLEAANLAAHDAAGPAHRDDLGGWVWTNEPDGTDEDIETATGGTSWYAHVVEVPIFGS